MRASLRGELEDRVEWGDGVEMVFNSSGRQRFKTVDGVDSQSLVFSVLCTMIVAFQSSFLLE
jgi:hypothetical protein